MDPSGILRVKKTSLVIFLFIFQSNDMTALVSLRKKEAACQITNMEKVKIKEIHVQH